MLKKSKKLLVRFVSNSIIFVILAWLLILIWLMFMAIAWGAEPSLKPVKNPPVEEVKLYGLNNNNWGENENAKSKSHPNDKIFHEKIQKIPNNESCVMKVIYYEKDDGGLVKEEILECADGRVAFDGPTYWQLFAEFYYASVNTPKYCRKYNRPNHPYKTYGKVCLDEKGNWK